MGGTILMWGLLLDACPGNTPVTCLTILRSCINPKAPVFQNCCHSMPKSFETDPRPNLVIQILPTKNVQAVSQRGRPEVGPFLGVFIEPCNRCGQQCRQHGQAYWPTLCHHIGLFHLLPSPSILMLFQNFPRVLARYAVLGFLEQWRSMMSRYVMTCHGLEEILYQVSVAMALQGRQHWFPTSSTCRELQAASRGHNLRSHFFWDSNDSHYVKRCKKNIEEPKHTKTILVCRNKVRQRFIWDLLRADAELTELTQGDGISWQFSGNKFVSYLRFSAILCDPLRSSAIAISGSGHILSGMASMARKCSYPSWPPTAKTNLDEYGAKWYNMDSDDARGAQQSNLMNALDLSSSLANMCYFLVVNGWSLFIG